MPSDVLQLQAVTKSERGDAPWDTSIPTAAVCIQDPAVHTPRLPSRHIRSQCPPAPRAGLEREPLDRERRARVLARREREARLAVEDPVAAVGLPEDIQRAFSQAFMLLHRRISLFASLPLARLEGQALKRELDQIGQSAPTQEA